MLGDPEDTPAAFAKFPVHFTIVLMVIDDLSLPELTASLRRSVALGATMPEAVIHEDRQPLLPNSKIGLTGKLQMTTPSGNSFFLKDLYQSPLRALIALAPDQGHYLGSLLLGEDVRGHLIQYVWRNCSIPMFKPDSLSILRTRPVPRSLA